MARVPSHRASDSDRELVAERLRHATGEGRLTPDELEERLDALYAARTYGQLDALVADLPVAEKQSHARSGLPRWAPAAAAVAVLIAVLSMLADALRHTAVAVGRVQPGPLRGPGQLRLPPGPLRIPGPFAEVHHGFMMAASMAGVFAVLVVFAVVIGLVSQLGRTSDP